MIFFYHLPFKKNNNIIKSAKDVNTGDKIDLKFSDGTKQAEILQKGN